MKPTGVLLLAALGACGTHHEPPSGPSWTGAVLVTSGTASTTCTTTVTVTFSATGVSPDTVSVPVGGCVDFKNADAVAHWPESDPYPTRTDCPWLNMTASIPAGGDVTVGPAPTPPMVCGFYDLLYPPTGGGGGGGGY